MRPDLDDFEELNNEPVGAPRSRAMSWLLLSVVVAGFATLAYYAYQSGTHSAGDGNMLVVNADQGPVKEVPANPGGEEFANKDKTIYDAVSSNGAAAPKVEKLLPGPEEPVMPEPAVESKTPTVEAPKENTTTFVNKSLSDKESADTSGKPATPAPAPAVAAAPAPTPTPAPAPVAATPPAAAPVVVAQAKPPAPAVAKPAEKPAAATPPAAKSIAPIDEGDEDDIISTDDTKMTPATPPVAAAPVASSSVPAPTAAAALAEKPAAKPAPKATGAYKIQLGAFKSEAEAHATWKRIADKHGDIVSGSPVIVKADLPNGTFYRLRASGFASADAAKSACMKLKAAGQDCLYVGK